MDDFFKFLDSLRGDNKTILYSILLTFPLAFIDCWKLSSTFPNIDFTIQLLLTLGVDLILVAGGIVLEVIYIYLNTIKQMEELSLPPLLFASVIATVLVILNIITTPVCFLNVFMITLGGFLLIAFIKWITKYIKKRAKKKNDSHNPTSDS